MLASHERGLSDASLSSAASAVSLSGENASNKSSSISRRIIDRDDGASSSAHKARVASWGSAHSAASQSLSAYNEHDMTPLPSPAPRAEHQQQQQRALGVGDPNNANQRQRASSKTSSFFDIPVASTSAATLDVITPPPNPFRSSTNAAIARSHSTGKSWLDRHASANDEPSLERSKSVGRSWLGPYRRQSDSPDHSPSLAPAKLPPLPSLPALPSFDEAPQASDASRALPPLQTDNLARPHASSISSVSSAHIDDRRSMSQLPSAIDHRSSSKHYMHVIGHPTPPSSRQSVASSRLSIDSRPPTPSSEPASIPDDVHPGDSFGPYTVVRLLGKGSFSRVALGKRRAVDTDHDDDVVALKLIDRASYEANERMRISVVREIEILKHLRHPNIVTFDSSFHTDKYTVVTLDYCEGGEMFDFLAKWHSNFTEPFVRRLFTELCSAVTWMHDIGLVHRDIKLENILLTSRPFPCLDPARALESLPSPFVKLTDFGLSRYIAPDHPHLSTRCGSEAYASPELIMGKKYDGRQTDAWALGVILYSFATGVLPFVEDESVPEQKRRRAFLLKIAKADYAWPASAVARLASDDLRAVVEKLLVRDPNKRSSTRSLWMLPWLRGEGTVEPVSGQLLPRDETDGPAVIGTWDKRDQEE